VEYVTKTERPDLIVVMAGNPVPMALAAQRTQCPILVELQNVEFQLHGGRFEDLCNVPCVANSRFTAEKYHQAYGVTPTVIYPYIEKVKYKTLTNRENITFINPVLIKGRDIALEIARRCPEIPFCFVESWTLSLEDRQGLMEKLRPLQNVVLHPPQDDMGKVYGKCRVLLAPSIYDEAYGRVATEAQLSGIPVIGSTRGGLPEAVGPGGILIDPSCPIDQWVAAVRRIWKDQAYYAELSAAAQAHAMRSEMCVDHQIAQWQEAFGNAVRSHHKGQSAAQNTQGESFRPLTDGRSA
jgi:glycosyltransferase involved in cell wall biosynthesis